MRGMGKNAVCALTEPTEMPVKPAKAPWTAFWPRTVHMMESWALATQPRTMYVGSMYLTSHLISALSCLQNH